MKARLHQGIQQGCAILAQDGARPPGGRHQHGEDRIILLWQTTHLLLAHMQIRATNNRQIRLLDVPLLFQDSDMCLLVLPDNSTES